MGRVILLSLNLNDLQYAKIERLIAFVNDAADNKLSTTVSSYEEALMHINTLAQCILKVEWNGMEWNKR